MDTSGQILRAFELTQRMYCRDYASYPMPCSLKSQNRMITFKTGCMVYDSEKAWVSHFKFKTFNNQTIEDPVKMFQQYIRLRDIADL